MHLYNSPSSRSTSVNVESNAIISHGVHKLKDGNAQTQFILTEKI